MRKLLALTVVTALIGVTVASVAAANQAGFSGTRVIGDDGRLHITFKERGVGKQPVSYRLQADGLITWSCGGVFYGTHSFGGVSWNDPWQRATITPDRGRTEGALMHETLLGATPKCPMNEHGEIPPTVMSATLWTHITVTSSTGRVLTLRDISRTF